MAKSKTQAPQERVYFFSQEGEVLSNFLYIEGRQLEEPLTEEETVALKALLEEEITKSPKDPLFQEMMEALIDGRYAITSDQEDNEGRVDYWYYGGATEDEVGEDLVEPEEELVEPEEENEPAPVPVLGKKAELEKKLDKLLTRQGQLRHNIDELSKALELCEKELEENKLQIAETAEESKALEDEMDNTKSQLAQQIKETQETLAKLMQMASQLGIS